MRFLVTVAMALMLAACMVGPDYQRPSTELPSAFPGAENTAGIEPVRSDWWRLFDDALLDELVATALAANIDVAQAVARIEEADANLRAVNAALFAELP